MQLARWSVSLFGTVAVLAALFAGATIWLLVTDPVTVAEASTRARCRRWSSSWPVCSTPR